ncbi:MAG: hypothetical protein IT236_08970 [Bacteroidia bacterium]|nr:hypothetical protein [Bacteroidia bacterium]
MLILKNNGALIASLKIRLASAKQTNDLEFYTSYYDGPSSSYGDSHGNTNGTASVLMVGPTIGQYRQIKYITVYNGDTQLTSIVLEVNKTDGLSTELTRVLSLNLDTGDTLIYTENDGFKVVDSNGKLKVTVAVGGGGGGGGGIALVAGANTVSNGSVAFQNTGGVSFGLFGTVLTASAPPTHFSAGTSAGGLANVVFNNANGIGFGLNGNTITASHNAITSQSLQPAINTISAGTAAVTNGQVIFSNSNGLSFGLDGNTLTASYTVPSTAAFQASSLMTNYLGTLATQSFRHTSADSQLFFASNSSNLQATSLMNNYLATAATQSFRHTSADSQLIFNSQSSNLQATSLMTNYLGTGYNTHTHSQYLTTAMLSNAATISNIKVSGGTSSAVLSAITFDNAGGVSFGLNGSVITASAPAAVASPINFSASNASANLGSVMFGNANGVSFGLAGSTVTASVNAGGGGVVALSKYPAYNFGMAYSAVNSGTTGNTGGSTQVSASGFLASIALGNDLHFSQMIHEHSISATIAGTGSATLGHQLGIYTLNGNSVLSLMSSFQNVMFMSQNSVTARTHHWYWGNNSNANSSSLAGNVSASFSGARAMLLNNSLATLNAGNYYLAYLHTMRTTGSALYYQSSAAFATGSLTTQGVMVGGNSSSRPYGFGGVFSTTANLSSIAVPFMPVSIHTSVITHSGGSSQWRVPYIVMQKSIT